MDRIDNVVPSSSSCQSIGLLVMVYIVVIGTANSNSSTTVMHLTQRNNHANISELLDNLLRGYDNSIRPGFGGKCCGMESTKFR